MGLIGVTIEQDAAYWEVHIEHHPDMSQQVYFGVATKKDQQFYRAIEEEQEGQFRIDSKGFKEYYTLTLQILTHLCMYSDCLFQNTKLTSIQTPQPSKELR